MDIVDENLIVNHDLVLQQLVALEHYETVSAALEHIVMGSKRISLIQVQIHAANLDVSDSVVAGYFDEFSRFIGLNRWFDQRIDV